MLLKAPTGSGKDNYINWIARADGSRFIPEEVCVLLVNTRQR